MAAKIIDGKQIAADMRAELKEEVAKLTLIVVAISVIVGIYLGGLDYIFTKSLEAVITR